MKVYRVWADVEEIDEEAGSYVCCECPQSLKEFATEKEAVAFAVSLSDANWDGPIEEEETKLNQRKTNE